MTGSEIPKSPPTINMNSQVDNIHSSTRQIIQLVIITLICLMPFIDKAFHIDDPLFIWTAKQIQLHPLDPYNFSVNWGGSTIPMYEETKNPPLACYYMALTAYVVGWSESGLHLAFLLPVIGFVLGTYALAKQFCSRPFDAALAAWFTPVVLVSSTTLMCDVIMLCFWVWATVLWVRGIRENSNALLIVASLFIALSALTKYFGMNLIFLLLIWTLAEKRRWENKLLFLFIPIIIMALYYWATFILYGRGLISDAANYALQFGSVGSRNYISGIFIGNAFMGGCLFTILFYINRLWHKRFLFIQIIIGIIIVSFLIWLRSLDRTVMVDDNGIRWSYILQFTLFTLAGINLLALAITDYISRKDSTSMLLLLWVLGTFLFGSLINWTINGRTLLPIAPAAGILIMRRVESRSTTIPGSVSWKSFFPLILGAVLSMLIAYADYQLANTIRADTATLTTKYRSIRSNIWFEGHWGFQYYMESFGCQAIDIQTTKIPRGDFIIIPKSNTALFPIPDSYAPMYDSLLTYPLTWLTTMNTRGRAGFYSDIWGPVPFIFGNTPPERYHVRLVQIGIKFH